MSEQNPTLFDNPDDEQARADRVTDLNEIIAKQKLEDGRLKAQSQSYLDARVKQDQQRIERAAEQGIDLTSRSEARRAAGLRGVQKAREALERAQNTQTEEQDPS